MGNKGEKRLLFVRRRFVRLNKKNRRGSTLPKEYIHQALQGGASTLRPLWPWMRTLTKTAPSAALQYGTQDRSVKVQCAVWFILYWLSDLLIQLNQVWYLSDIPITRLPIVWECKPSEPNGAQQICVMLLPLSQLNELWGQRFVFHSPHHHLLVYLCSARRPPSVFLCTEPPDRTMLIQVWQQINKLYSLSISVGGYKKNVFWAKS